MKGEIMRQILRVLSIVTFCLFSSVLLFSQTDRGTITGAIADSTGAVIPGANITATNIQTTSKYETVSTETGNYTLTQLPVGSYEVTVELPGFKKYVRQGVTVLSSTTVRIDVALEVGGAAEEVTVSADAPLLRTETGDVSHNIRTDAVDALPVLSIGAAAGSSGIRNPTAVAQLLPGAYVVPNTTVKINGAPGNTASYRVEGQDASNGQVPATQAQVQPSVDALQEITVLTSNFSAEYGQVGGGMFNYVVKSGSNQYHGSGYDYAANDAFNSATPWLNTKSPVRRHDWGFTVGGPAYLGKLYDGHNKTFFFFNFEQYRDHQNISTITNTVPIQEYRDGNFAKAITGKVLGTDPLQRPIIEGTIYDPNTTRTAPNGQLVRDPFLNNVIPLDRMDPVALKVQAMIPLPNRSGFTNNYLNPFPSDRITYIPAVKLDHNLSARAKVSYYWSQTKTSSQYSTPLGGADGLPEPVTAAIGTFITARVQRLNFDYTVSPTILFHIGAGYQTNHFTDDPGTTNYDAAANLGLTGTTSNRIFPSFQGLTITNNSQGGVKNLGPGNSTNRHPLMYEKPTANVSLSWTKDNHTYKFGGETRIESNASTVFAYTAGTYTFSTAQTGLPTVTQAGGTVGGGTVGFPYASFLLGLVDQVRVAPPNTIRLGKHSISGFAQDTWKLTRKLTLDYGLRYDFQTYLKEQYGRLAQFSPTTPNPSAGGLPGAVIFEGSGPGRCNCSFAKNYPWAFGPRLAAAYQFAPKMVLRVGLGVVYSGTGDANGATQGGLTAVAAVQAPGDGSPIMTLRNGNSPAPPFPNFDPGQYPQAGYAGKQAPLTWYDQNAGRPARQLQWSIGVQREIFQNLAVEVAYVGNRGVWWNSPGLIDVNALTPERIASVGLDLNSTADQNLLKGTLAAAASRGFKAPYVGYPTSVSLAQSLRPFPQFNSITSLWSPLGKTWYDSLQVKATKRLSYGLSFASTFTYSKNLSMGSASNVVAPGTGGAPFSDVFKRDLNKYISQFDQPYIFNTSLNYTLPKIQGNRIFSTAVRDWTIGVFVQYASGLPILAPAAQNGLNSLLLRNTGATTPLGYANRVPGQPLFLKDLNCHCFDPNKEFVLNPAAWADPAPGTFGKGAAYYSDYRQQRQPVENFAFGRDFKLTGEGKVKLNIRAEFSNIFNRSRLPNATSTSALATRTYIDANGKTVTLTAADSGSVSGKASGGFGWINTASAPSTPASRQGQIVGRITF
jgi:hypothetical protein